MSLMSLDAVKQLSARAEGIKSDILADHPQYADQLTGYDLWVEELRHHQTGNRTWYGVINMGDLYAGTFEWDGRDWNDSPEDPHEIIKRIETHRAYKARW